jgi:LacI family gluconate utilization system Gnt-I transcriptional repressor
LRAIKAMGYVHNLVAGSLASRRTRVVAAIFPGIDNPAYGKTILGASEVLRKSRFHLLLGHHEFSPSQEENLIAAFLGRRPDGLILHDRRHTPEARGLLKGAGIPIVEVGDLAGPPLDIVVSYSNYDAGKAMTGHLARQGYREIAMVCLPRRESGRHYQRWRGYRAALHEAGLAYNARRVVETSLGYHQGGKALLTLLNRDPSIDAVFFTSDVLAVGALLECLRRGWNVPGRVAIAGFDDQDIASEVIPSLTTVRVPRKEIGGLAAQMLLDRFDGKAVDPKILNVGFQVIERDSA